MKNLLKLWLAICAFVLLIGAFTWSCPIQKLTKTPVDHSDCGCHK